MEEADISDTILCPSRGMMTQQGGNYSGREEYSNCIPHSHWHCPLELNGQGFGNGILEARQLRLCSSYLDWAVGIERVTITYWAELNKSSYSGYEPDTAGSTSTCTGN